MPSIVKKYVKKPVVVEAMQFKKGMSLDDVRSFVKDAAIGLIGFHESGDGDKCTSCEIATQTGNTIILRDGDYIIKNSKGTLYLCSPGIFKDSYEEVAQHTRQELGIFS